MDLVKGQKTKCILVSESGEEARISLQQGLDFSPNMTEEDIPEFDNDEPAVIISKVDKYDASLTYLESSDKKVAAILMNLPINSAVVPLNPANFKKVAWYANCKGENGNVFRSFIAKPGTVKGNPVSVQVDSTKNAKKLDLSHPAIYDIVGAAIQRDKFASTDFAKTTENYQATLTKTAVDLPAGTIADTAQKVLFVRKNGEVVTEGFTVTTNKLDIGNVQPAQTDVWEVFYCYVDTAA